MNFPIEHGLSTQGILGNSSIEAIRNELTNKIETNDCLDEEQKDNALEELDLLLLYEKYRRMLRMIYQLKAERMDHMNNMRDRVRSRHHLITEKRQEHKHRLLLNRKETILRIAQIDSELYKLKPQRPEDKDKRKINDELNRIKNRARMRRESQAEVERELRDRVIRKAQFLQKVRKHFPDLEEEMMDEYDRQMYDSDRGNN